jgi:hypothetical protein
MQSSLSELPKFLPSVVCLAVLAAFSTGAPAQQLLITADTETQGAGGNQLEMAYNRERTRTAGESERLRSFDLIYTYGLAETLDVYASVNHSRLRAEDSHASGSGNTAIGAKWRFFEDEASGASLAVQSEIALPVSSRREDDGLGAGRTSGSLIFILSQDLPFGSVHFNAGVGRERYRHDDHATLRSFSVSPIWDISEQWKVAFDMGVDLSRSGGNTARSKFTEITAVYTPTEAIEMSLAYIRTTDDEHPRSKTHGVAAGMTWWF